MFKIKIKYTFSVEKSFPRSALGTPTLIACNSYLLQAPTFEKQETKNPQNTIRFVIKSQLRV